MAAQAATHPAAELGYPANAKALAALAVVLALALLALAPQQAFAQYEYAGSVDTAWYEEGTDTFTLTTRAQLAGLAYLVDVEKVSFADKTVLLGADIDLEGIDWCPIGDPYRSDVAFRGTFDGQGHEISGLYIYNEQSNQALFANIRGAAVRNLTVRGSVTCDNFAAGIVASADSSELSNLVNYADVVGGGPNAYIDTSARYNGDAAGVVCKSVALGPGETTYENLVNYGSVRGASPSGTGGTIGDVACGEGHVFNIVNCANHGDVYIANTENVDGVSDGAGGVVGSTGKYGTYHIAGCTNTGSITSNNLGSVGGVVGFLGGVGSTIDHSGNEGAITNLATEFDSPTTDVPASGGVVSRFDSEGGSVSNSYSMGTTSASTGHSAGIIGSSAQGFSVASNNYYLEGSATGAFNDSDTGVASDRLMGGQSATAEELAGLMDAQGGVREVDLAQLDLVPISAEEPVAAEPASAPGQVALAGMALALVVAAALACGAAWEYRAFRRAVRRPVAGGAL